LHDLVLILAVHQNIHEVVKGIKAEESGVNAGDDMNNHAQAKVVHFPSEE
jgi:hypothetical protein